MDLFAAKKLGFSLFFGHDNFPEGFKRCLWVQVTLLHTRLKRLEQLASSSPSLQATVGVVDHGLFTGGLLFFSEGRCSGVVW